MKPNTIHMYFAIIFYVKSRQDLTLVLPGLTYDGIPRSYLRYSTILLPLFVVKLNKLLAAGNRATARACLLGVA